VSDEYSDAEIGGLGSGPRYPVSDAPWHCICGSGDEGDRHSLMCVGSNTPDPIWYGHPSREPYDFEAAATSLAIVCGVHEQSTAMEVIRKVIASAYGYGRDDEVENVPLPEFVEKWGPNQ
jgi:hypothetical protein